jgi:outer membrane protein assembly factor BamB
MKRTNISLIIIALFLGLALPGAQRQPLWKVVLPAEFAGAPAVSGRTAVVAIRSGELLALDSLGKTAWTQKLAAGCLAAPAIDADGDIYVACADGSLLRFTSTGREVWRTGPGQETLATPLLGNDVLYAVAAGGRVSKVRKQDGAVLKQAELGVRVHSSPVWDAQRRLLLVPAMDFCLLALDTELEVRWRFRTAGVIYSVPAVTPRNEIFLTSLDHHLYKLDHSGRLLWKFKAAGWINASPVVDGKGRAYVGSYDRYFYAVSAAGRELWRFQGRAQFTASAVIDRAGFVYCGDTSGTIYALDRRGRLAWEYKSPDFITGQMTILPDRVLLAGSIDGTLLAFAIEQPLSRRAWWAKFLGNLANSGFDED